MKKTPIKRKTPLRSYTPLKRSGSIKTRQKTAKKLKQEYCSIFTDNMHICYITRDTRNVEPHHIFHGADKALSEKYGFMLPLRSDWHRTGDYAIHKNRKMQIEYRMKCQDYYINVLNKTKEEWLEEFARWWVPED